jgi:glycosyltransferase involved in cell wall biosynthesis
MPTIPFGISVLTLEHYPPYSQADFIGALVVSEDNKRYLSYAFPGFPCERLYLTIDYHRFAFVPWHNKSNQIAYMTRKNHDDVAQVVKILSNRGLLGDWRLVPIQGLPESDVSLLMGESKLFISFGHPEGFSLSNLEALAYGCHVINYTGRAARQYFLPTKSTEIEVGDIIGFCNAIESFVATEQALQSSHSSSSSSASSFVRSVYSKERETSSVIRGLSRFLFPECTGSPA